jgi:hypothetical protein
MNVASSPALVKFAANVLPVSLDGHRTAQEPIPSRRSRAAWRKKRINSKVCQAYGIFHLAEFAILTHLPLRRLPSPLGSPQAILQRFGISP